LRSVRRGSHDVLEVLELSHVDKKNGKRLHASTCILHARYHWIHKPNTSKFFQTKNQLRVGLLNLYMRKAVAGTQLTHEECGLWPQYRNCRPSYPAPGNQGRITLMQTRVLYRKRRGVFNEEVQTTRSLKYSMWCTSVDAAGLLKCNDPASRRVAVLKARRGL
jgi:hypothetical protein